MLSELCKELNNWFNYNQPKYFGDFVIDDGELLTECDLQDGQYYRIVGSLFNDGVHQHPADDLTDEMFSGALWAMAIPSEVIALADEIDAWKAKYQSLDSPSMSPFDSESFGGYSYSKSSGRSSSGNVDLSGTWQGVFADRLNHWRKIRP